MGINANPATSLSRARQGTMRNAVMLAGRRLETLVGWPIRAGQYSKDPVESAPFPSPQ